MLINRQDRCMFLKESLPLSYHGKKGKKNTVYPLCAGNLYSFSGGMVGVSPCGIE